MSRWAAQTSRVRVSAPSRPSPPLYPHFNWPSGFWPCVKSCLVGGSDKYRARSRRFGWAVWHSCRMGARNQEQTRGRIGPQLRLGNLWVGELHFCPLCTALDQASSLSRKLAYVPGPTFGFVKLLASSGSHCTKWADETSPPLYPHFNWPSGFWPCVKSCLVGGSDKYMARCWRAFFCVLWWGPLDRLWLRAARFGRVCSTTGYITSGLRGPSPQALTLFGGVGFIARYLRRPEKGNADGVRGIFGTAYRVGLRPCDRTHLKNGLVPYSYAGGA